MASSEADRITDYLENGGLFNPEQMEHDKVRMLLMDCRTALAEKDKTIERLAQACAEALIILDMFVPSTCGEGEGSIRDKLVKGAALAVSQPVGAQNDLEIHKDSR